MSEAGLIKLLKQGAEAVFFGDYDRSGALALVRKAIAGAVTNNQSHVAACLAGAVAPDEVFVVSAGWEGDHHGGLIAKSGRAYRGHELLELAILTERTRGPHGRTLEFGGYADAWRAGYLLALRYAAPKAMAADIIRIELLCDYLLTTTKGETIEIGGRATGGKNDSSTAIQALWRGETPRVPKSGATTAARMFAGLTEAELAAIGTAPTSWDEAIAELVRLNPVIPCGWQWWGFGIVGSFRVQVNAPRGHFIQKRTGPLMVVAHADGSIQPRADNDRTLPVLPSAVAAHIHITEAGVVESSSGHSPPPAEPAPPPRPEPPQRDPEDPAGEPGAIAELARAACDIADHGNRRDRLQRLKAACGAPEVRALLEAR